MPTRIQSEKKLEKCLVLSTVSRCILIVFIQGHLLTCACIRRSALELHHRT